MGMIGTYIAIEQELLDKIINGDIDILDLDPNQYQSLDIDKSWQAIQFLLCGDIDEGAPPLGYVVPMQPDNGIECELDYGAFYLNNLQISEAYSAMNSLTKESLLAKFDINEFVENEIHPVITNEDGNSFFEYIYQYFMKILEFYKSICFQNKGIIFYVM